jgi:hypothetical protein
MRSRHLRQLHLPHFAGRAIHLPRIPRQGRHLAHPIRRRRRLVRHHEPEQPHPHLLDQHDL